MNYSQYFELATARPPYPYQEAFAVGESLPGCIEVPTGAGKTATIVVGWLYRRQTRPLETPKRLVYCLPMRVLVEQTLACVDKWLENLGLKGKVKVACLMGGERTESWDTQPEADCILVGTQDMLLSRALMRGYGMSRYRWPLHFGLLHNDSLWVLDELQLLGPGLTTSVQLEAFRRRWGTYGPQATLWMSATIRRKWLETVDFQPDHHPATLKLCDEDRAAEGLSTRLHAKKPIRKARASAGDAVGVASEVLDLHQPGTLSLVICNTVKRASEIVEVLAKRKAKADLVLLHSRFRPADRKRALERVLAAPGAHGTIVVSTQVVEAGVDLNARLMVTELAPWGSLVQRFGRCNRTGTIDDAEVLWLDLPAKVSSRPYEEDQIEAARTLLADLQDVGPARLPAFNDDFPTFPLLRSKDVLELFDTTADLAGFDLDVSRFIRESDDSDAQVFWRALDKPDENELAPAAGELCSVPLADLRSHLKKRSGWIRDSLEGTWVEADAAKLFGGVVVMLRSAEGGYQSERGWDPSFKGSVSPVDGERRAPQSLDDDRLTAPRPDTHWETVAQHTQAVVDQMLKLLHLLPEGMRDKMITACRWHDVGKALPAFQAKFIGQKEGVLFAKAPQACFKVGRLPDRDPKDGQRKHFRHELGSAVAAVQHKQEDLVSYLCACHHGKVRMSLRPMPGEYEPAPGRRFARGVWDGDELPELDLGGGIRAPQTTLDLSLMELGLNGESPSWLERCLRLLEELGPFRLAYLEALIKCADERGSAASQAVPPTQAREGATV